MLGTGRRDCIGCALCTHLACYAACTATRRCTQQLFVCYSNKVDGKSMSKQRLAHLLHDGISQARVSVGREPPVAIRMHSAWSVAGLMAFLSGISTEEVWIMVSWSMPNRFIRFYPSDMTRCFPGSVLTFGTQNPLEEHL